MRIKYLLRLQQIELNRISSKRQTIIWQILAENSFEVDIIDYISRFLEIETIKEIEGILTVIDNELVYHAAYLKNSFKEKEFIDDLATGYIYEKGGIQNLYPIYKSFEKIKDFICVPAAKSGVTFSKKSFSEFYK
ncbi:MAG: hypothetical protein WAU11_04055 [Ignavibacteriaceae bacterium]